MINSIRGKIACLFIIALVCICTLFFAAHQALRSHSLSEELGKISLITQSVSRFSSAKEQTNNFLKELNFELIAADDERHQKALKRAKIYLTQAAPFGDIKVFYANEYFYLQINDHAGSRAYKFHAQIDRHRAILMAACIICIFILAVLFWLIILGLQPINELVHNIRIWSSGHAQRPALNINSSDEIGILAQEFDAAAEKIDSLIYSRQLFLRSVMHELKTPLGKGRIIAALPPSEANYARLDAIFTRLELLVDEFGQAERVLSRYYKPHRAMYRCSLVYEQAMDILMLDDESIITADFGDDVLMNVDLQLFALMLKNLIDNAIKYCTGGQIFVSFTPEFLCVQNRGAPLDAPIGELMQAFRQGDSTRPGLGLGLYLIDRIAQMHGCKLTHEYDGWVHSFKVHKSAPECRLCGSYGEGCCEGAGVIGDAGEAGGGAGAQVSPDGEENRGRPEGVSGGGKVSPDGAENRGRPERVSGEAVSGDESDIAGVYDFDGSPESLHSRAGANSDSAASDKSADSADSRTAAATDSADAASADKSDKSHQTTSKGESDEI